MIESPAKSKLATTNYLSPRKACLYHKINNEPSEILRKSKSMLSSLGPSTPLLDDVFNLARTQIVLMLIVLPSFFVYIAYSHCSA